MKIWGPRLLHGMLAAATDIWLYKLSTRIVGQRYANVAVSILPRAYLLHL